MSTSTFTSTSTMTLINPLVDSWRRRKSAAFDLTTNSTSRETMLVDYWGRRLPTYTNANLSIYSGERCNARCAFCVEELRPASRGRTLAQQRTVESDDDRYFAALDDVLDTLQTLDPSTSITGGEPSRDPRLPRILRALAARGARKRTITTNGSGLLDAREGKRVIDWIADTGISHLNISIAHPDPTTNAKLMRYEESLDEGSLRGIVIRASASGTRVRLSCVLVEGAIDSLSGVVEFLEYARSLGVDNVVFRQLMLTDPETVQENFVVKFSDRRRVRLEPLLDDVADDPRFLFERQVMGYYYYVEVYRFGDIDVVFEEADLAQLERTKRTTPDVVFELVFHPDATLASTWQSWDGVLRSQ